MAKTDWHDGDNVNAAALNVLGSEVNAAEEVQWFTNFAGFPSSGQVTDKIYGDRATGSLYRWNGSSYATVGGGGGNASTNTSTSVDGEVALFSGTGGKTLKRSTLTGIPYLVSGVQYAATEGTDYYKPGGTDVSLADGGTGVSLTDPNADRIMFWDDSASAVTWLAPGAGLSITGTTLNAGAVMVTVGTTASPITDPSTARPSGAAAVYWICASGVTPTNAQTGDLIFNA